MAQSKRREEWNHTASLMALVLNSNPYRKKSEMVHPRDIHPMERSSGPTLKIKVSSLKGVFGQ